MVGNSRGGRCGSRVNRCRFLRNCLDSIAPQLLSKVLHVVLTIVPDIYALVLQAHTSEGVCYSDNLLRMDSTSY